MSSHLDRKGILAEATLGEINRAAVPLTLAAEDYDPLLHWIGSRRLVLIGQASHGTHGFYSERATITRRLIAERGFNAVVIEGDWPDVHRVHRFVTGRGSDANARDALAGFQRFPAWVWRNMDVLAFLDWLRHFNGQRPPAQRAGFYGLDLYCLHASMRAVLDSLHAVDSQAEQRTRYRCARFDHFGEDSQAEGYAASLGMSKESEDEVVAQLAQSQRLRADCIARDGEADREDDLLAEQNARLAQNAEHYYRVMLQGGAESWNLRERHMGEALDRLMRTHPETKAVVWAHNSHLGDARATEMAEHGVVNLGQMARESFADEVYSVGFTTHSGEVTAASAWDRPAERKIVRPALSDSYESLFHHTQIPAFLLSMRDPVIRPILDRPRLERAIGVIYQPESERVSHYLRCRLSAQFDAVIHLDRTKAIVPFERTAGWAAGEVPDAYPYAV